MKLNLNNSAGDTELWGKYSDDITHEYSIAEKKAQWYLNKIESLTKSDVVFERLHGDLKSFCKTNSRIPKSRLTLMQKAANGELTTWQLLDKLAARKELENYLTKTISYLYIRDLGLDLNQKQSKQKVQNTVKSLMKKVANGNQALDSDLISIMPWMQKKEFRPAYYWLMLKLSGLKNQFSDNEANHDGLRKLVKVIVGILMHHMTEDETSSDNTPQQLTKVVQLGYAYGLTYPFVDDLLDSNDLLSEADKATFSQALRQTLLTGKVVAYPSFENDSEQLRAIYKELKWAFEFIQETLEGQQSSLFFQRASVFFEAQAIDRDRSLKSANQFSLHELLKTVIIKSASSRLISRDLVLKNQDTQFDDRVFCFGIYNQFNDDIKDIEEDQRDNNLTPYTWYLARENNHGINPYHYYWAVVYYLVYEVYQNNQQIKELFFERSINALKSVYSAQGDEAFEKLSKQLLNTPNTSFNQHLLQFVKEQSQEVWFDKLLSKEVSSWIDTKRLQTNGFREKYNEIKDKVNQHLSIEQHALFEDGKLHKVANYSVKAGGKRIRAVMASVLSTHLYGFSDEQQIAVRQLLEYMHSASLILDDLPSQDDAATRRGKASAHVQFQSVAKAELGSVYLMMKAIEVQAGITCHPAPAVLKSLQYASSVTQAICEGQLLDIETSGKAVSSHCLEKICYFKTGLAIEAALVIPAILAEQDELHIKQLKNLAKHMGLMFQIRDDLLDLTGNNQTLGKPTHSDEYHKRMNFVSVYSEQKAVEVMFEHHDAANRLVADMQEVQAFFSELFDYIIYRDK